MVKLRAITIASFTIALVACKDPLNAPAFFKQLTIVGVTPRVGSLAGGTSLTITGVNFIDVTSVNVGGIELIRWTVLSKTEIVGTTPPATSAGPRDVVVMSRRNGGSNCGGCFRYDVVPPTVTAVNPAIGPAAGGTRVTITGTEFTDVAQVLVGTHALLDLAVTSATQITGRIPPSTNSGAADVVAVSRENLTGRCSGCFRYEQAGDTAIIVLTPNRIALNPGEQARATLRLPRVAGATQNITTRVIAAPPGVTVSLHDGTGVFGQFLISILVRTNVPPGDYRIEIGTLVSGAPELTSTLALTVLPRTTTGNTTAQFCGMYPFLVAYQDGDGPWTRASGAGDYRFNITAGRGAIAVVEGSYVASINLYAILNTKVFFGTQAELNEAFSSCETRSAPLAYMQVAVSNAPTHPRIALGNVQISGVTSYQLPVLAVPSDLVVSYQNGWEGFGTGITGKAIIRRNLNPAAGTTSVPLLDFNAPEAVQLVTRRLQDGNTAQSVWVELLTSNGTNALLHCVDPYNYGGCSGSSSFLALPTPQPGDVHRLIAITQNGWQMSCFAQPLDQWLNQRTLGSVSVSTAATIPSVRFRARYTRQAEYSGGVQVTYASNQPTTINPDRSVELNVSAAYLGTAPIVDLTIPDLSTIEGWDNDWGLQGTANVRFEVRGWTESTTGGARCGGRAEPFGRTARPQASLQYAAWTLRTVAPTVVSGSARRQ